MICYAVVDTNVLVSALLTSHINAATVQVVGRLFTGEVIPLFNEEILKEYNEVLRRKKFKFREELVAALLDIIEKTGQMIQAKPSGEILADIKDLPFYEVVLAKQDEAAFLVTGNIKHFPKRPFVVTPNEFLDIINQK